TGMRSGKAAMLRASSTRPPIAKTSLHALAAAMAPKSAGSSTSGGKKSVVDTTAVSSSRRYTAASSNGVRPTSRPGAAAPASVFTRPSSGEAPHLAAQPPHDVHSVRRRVDTSGTLGGREAHVSPRLLVLLRGIGSDEDWPRPSE